MVAWNPDVLRPYMYSDDAERFLKINRDFRHKNYSQTMSLLLDVFEEAGSENKELLSLMRRFRKFERKLVSELKQNHPAFYHEYLRLKKEENEKA